MTTPVAAVVTAVMASLQASPAVAAQVARVRMRPFTEATTAAVAVRPIDAQREESELGFAGASVWAVRFAVECYARSTSAPDMAVDALLEAVHTRLMANPTLSGVVPGGIAPAGISFDFDADGDQLACGTFVFTARVPSGPSFN